MSGGDVSADTLANYENELPHVPRLSASTSLVKHLGVTSHILVGTPSLDPSLRVGGDFLEIPGLGWQHDTPWTQHESKLKADRRTPHHALSTQPATLCARPDHRGPQRGRDRPYRLRYPCACRRRRETRRPEGRRQWRRLGSREGHVPIRGVRSSQEGPHLRQDPRLLLHRNDDRHSEEHHNARLDHR